MALESTVPFKINIPTALKDRLSQAAERSGRSLTSEILTRLEASLSLGDEGIDLTFDGLTKMIDDATSSRIGELEDRLDSLERDVSSLNYTTGIRDFPENR